MKLHAWALAGSVLATSWLAPAAFADPASEALLRGFVERIDKAARWSAKAGSIASQGPVTVLSGLTIAREDGSFAFTGGELRFETLSADQGLSASAISARGLAFKGRDFAAAIPRADVKGFAAPDLGGWTLDETAPATSIARLYTQLSRTQLDLLSIAEMTAGESASKGARLSGFVIEGLKDGKLRLNHLGRLEGFDSAKPAERFAIQGLSARDIDLAAIARVFDPDAYAGGKGNGTWAVAVGGGTYGSVEARSATGETFAIAAMPFGAISVRQPDIPVATAIDRIVALGDDPPPDKLWPVLEQNLPSLTGWAKLASIAWNGIAVRGKDNENFDLATAVIEDLSPDGLKRMAVEGLRGSVQGSTFALKRFELGDIAFPPVLSFLWFGRLGETGQTGTPPEADLVKRVVEAMFDGYPAIGRIGIEGISVSVMGGEPLLLDSYRAEMTDYAGPIPLNAKADLVNLVVPGAMLRMTPEGAAFFDALGYDRLVVGGSGAARYDDKTGDYASDTRMSVENAGMLAVSYALGGLTVERLKALAVPLFAAQFGGPDPGQLIAAAGDASFNGFKLRFEDASLTGRLIAYGARMQGQDEQTFVANSTAMMQLGLSQLQHPDFARGTVAAVTAFLNAPGSLTLTMAPPKPVTAPMALTLDPAKPGGFIDLFGVRVTAND